MYLNEVFKVKYPFIQGGMANIAMGEFAAAVSNSGGLGVIAAGGMKAEDLKKQIEICRNLTDKPFGVNLMLLNPETDKMAEIVSDLKIPFVTTGAGNPSKYIEMFKSNNVKVFPVVPGVTLARRLERAGVDAVIAEGSESGGHIGDMTTMTLVPQVVEAIKIPVIAAGGIASGKQLLAAEVLGASGFQMGTVFLATKECPIHEKYKDAILKARGNDSIVTGRKIGVPVRLLKNAMSRAYLKKEQEGASKMDLEKFTLGSLRKAVNDGDIVNGSLMAGQVAAQIDEIKTLEELFLDLTHQYNLRKKELGFKSENWK